MTKRKTLHGNTGKIDPKTEINPLNGENVVTDNVYKDGEYLQRYDYEANFCRDWVDENHK